MKKPRSIEANLISLGVALGLLIAVLGLMLFGIERSLGTKLDHLGSSTLPAQQDISALRHAVSRLFEREVQVLSARSEAELEPLRERAAIERELAESERRLVAALPDIVGRAEAVHEDALLQASTRDVLDTDASLFDSVRNRLSLEAEFEARRANLRTEVDALTQDARAVAGIAHLEYVLELRRVAGGASSDKMLRGDARVQQEAAGEVVIAVLQLGQLFGKIAGARNQDELNSIVANELSQNSARARTQLRALNATLTATDPAFARASRLQEQLDAMVAEVSAARDQHSLVELRRRVLAEASQGVELRGRILKHVSALSQELEAVEHIVVRETQEATRSARRATWSARLLTPLALLAALAVGWHSARRLRDSVHALRGQNRELESLSHDLKSMNEGLEGLVAERSAALVARERSMRLVLDAMSEGLVAADLDGALAGECSKAAVSWFGAPAPGTPLWEYLFPRDERLQKNFQVGYAQLAADLMPFEVSADCMPTRFEQEGKVFALGYRQVFEEERFRRVLVVVDDITHEVATETRERDAREQHQLLAHLLKDKQGFREFVRDSERLLSELRAAPERERALRLLHTLKGNTAVFGMEGVARRCHELEETLAERGDDVTPQEVKELAEFWNARLARIEELLTADGNLEIKEDDFASLVHGLRQRRDYGELLVLVESFKWTRASLLLRRYGAQAQRVAERLEKNVEVRVEHNNLLLMPGTLEEFWSSFVHVVRNAVDHGIETEMERLELGKRGAGTLVLRTSELAGGGLCVELADDGRGIDFARLRAACEAHGLPGGSREELIEAMFQNGVTTCDEATEVSGRGVGLGAVVSACRAAGGRVEVDTDEGKGTRFRFAFPKHAVQVREGVARSLRKPSARPSGPLRAVNT